MMEAYKWYRIVFKNTDDILWVDPGIYQYLGVYDHDKSIKYLGVYDYDESYSMFKTMLPNGTCTVYICAEDILSYRELTLLEKELYGILNNY
jgi:hypothetical protein